MTTTATSWRDIYLSLAEQIAAAAPRAATVLAGSNACVDAVYRIDTRRLELLTRAADRDGDGPELIKSVFDRVSRRRGGELVRRWRGGAAWFAELLGEPDALQVGGTGPQVSWSLAMLGTRSVCALEDRSAAQLAVLDPRTLLCVGDALVPASQMTPEGAPTKQRHVVLEFSADADGTRGRLQRSTRLILRFSDEPIERDNAFARLTPQLPDVRAGLASGLNGPADDDGDSERWLRAVADRWRSADILVHHELAEFPSIARLAAALDIGLADSVGMSLSELTMLAGAGDPRLLSRAVVERARASRIIVHADEWALCVFRSDQRPAGATLLGGASLAAARARAGRPTSELVPADHAHFTDDLPVSGSLGDGWWATAVPIPYLRHPAATIGLGDTFTAGVLLVDSLPDSALVDLT